jgi:VanZ family protein
VKPFFTPPLPDGRLSFVVEVVQAYIPQRDSGITDIITNTLGSALGALLARPTLIRAILRGTIGR